MTDHSVLGGRATGRTTPTWTRSRPYANTPSRSIRDDW